LALRDAECTDPDYNPMIPQVIVLQSGLVIDKVYNGDWFFGRRTLEDLRSSALAPLKKRAQKKSNVTGTPAATTTPQQLVFSACASLSLRQVPISHA
jgi:hypothetical protein